MKKAIFILATLLYTGLQAQKLIPYRLNDLWGYADESGKIIIEPRFTEANFFRSDGFAIVRKDTVIVLIDASGKEILPGIYTSIFEFSNGFAAVCRDGQYNWIQGEILGGKWGYINEKFEEVIPCQFSRAQSFQGDYAIVQKEDNWGPWGLIDKLGKMILPFNYKSYSFDMRPFPGLIWGPVKGTLQKDLTGKGEVWQVIDLKGRPQGVKYNAMHGKPAFYETAFSGEDFYSIQYPQKTGPIKLKNAQGKIITLDRKTTSIQARSSSLFAVGIPANNPPSDSNPDEKKYALINAKGDILIEFGQYDYFDIAADDRMPVWKNSLHGFLDAKTGQEVIPAKYDYTENFTNGYAHVYYNYSSRRNKIDGYINREGKEFFHDDPVINVVHQNNGLLLDEHNTLLMPNWISPDDPILVFGNIIKINDINGNLKALGKLQGKVNEFESWEEYCCRLYAASVFTHSIDSVTTRIKQVEFKKESGMVITSLTDTLFLVTKDGKNGLMGPDGKVLIAPRFDELRSITGKITNGNQAAILVVLENLNGAYSLNGKEILPPTYDAIQEQVLKDGNPVFLVTKGDFTGVIDAYGKVLLDIKYSRIEPMEESTGGSSYQLIADNNERIGIAKNFSKIITPVVNNDVNMKRWRNHILFTIFNKGYSEILDSLGKVIVPKEYANDDLFPEDPDIRVENLPMYFTLYNKKKYGIWRGYRGLIVPITKSSLEIYGANQKIYFVAGEKKKYGLLDGDGKEILPPVYDLIEYAGTDDAIFIVTDKDDNSYNLKKDYKLVKIEDPK